MTCLADLSELQINGNVYQTNGARVMFQVTTCKGHDYCRSEEEIDRFVESHSLYFIYNQQYYNSEGYGESHTIQNTTETKL